MTTNRNERPDESIRLLPLGGLDEDGKNMLVIEIDQDIYILEAGIKFPEIKQALGVECIIPDFTYLIENSSRIKGIIITHGHDDVMAALPYLLKQVPIDVYASPFTAAMIRKILKQQKIHGIRIVEIKGNTAKKIGGRTVSFFGITHSFPQAFGFALQTEYGSIVYTGEFIEDYEFSPDLYRASYQKLVSLGQKGVLILMQDSKGAQRNGHTSPDHRVTPHFEKLLENYDHSRIFAVAYTQSVFRIQEMIDCCIRLNRRMCFYTPEIRDLVKQLELISDEIDPRLIVSPNDLGSCSNCVIFVCGQGRALFQLMSNISNNEVPDLHFEKKDVIAVAAPLIPGVENEFRTMENDIYMRDGIIVRVDKDVVGMHPSKEDLKMMISMLEPKYYMPIKGEYRMLCANAMVALEMGISEDNIIILDNGQVAMFENGDLVGTEEVLELHDSMIDGDEGWDKAGVVLKDREILSTDGVMVLGIGLDTRTKKIVNGPDVQSRGLIFLKNAEDFNRDICRIMEETVAEMVENKTYSNMDCRSLIRERVGRYVLKATAKRPMILPIVLEINE